MLSRSCASRASLIPNKLNDFSYLMNVMEQVDPARIWDVAQLAARDLTGLTDQEILVEADQRRELEAKWVAVYWSDFIPFAHGGQ